MATFPQTRDGHFNPTSPHSSSGAADSFNGTPDTRLTVFSPEDGSSRSKATMGYLNVGVREPGPIRFGAADAYTRDNQSFNRSNLQLEKDPFVSTSTTDAKSAQKLSPTASVFSPFLAPQFQHTSVSESLGTPKAASERASGQATAGSSNTQVFVHDRLSTELGLSRCLTIHAARSRVSASDVENYLSNLEELGICLQGTRQVFECDDRTFLRFSNIRSACAVFSSLSEPHRPGNAGQGWVVGSISARDFSSIVEPTAGIITAHEGQLYINVFATSAAIETDAKFIESMIRNLFRGEGDLFAFKVQSTGGAEGSLLSAVVEYCDNDMSLQACSRFNSTVVNGLQVCITLYRPDIPSLAPSMQSGMITPIRSSAAPRMDSDFVSDFQRMSMSRTPSVVPVMHNAIMATPGRSPRYHLQPTYGMMPILYHGVPVTPPYAFDQVSSRGHNGTLPSGNYLISPTLSQSGHFGSEEFMTPRQYQLQSRRQNAMRVARSPYHSASNNTNHVDIKVIQDGQDVRTTIMLRNIPNKVDQAMLKRIVDESSWGKYDFMYLRIDFANDCNVGYAFINFVDPLDIIDFVRARGNQRWNCFKSDKVAEISYATIQGKDCLVQKFRNSSVMLEAPHYRPKLYYTSNGPVPAMAGNEEAFPGPDNQSKMKRSCENAEHVGLFTPNAGQHFRDEQRRRRSQFDRGTRLAALEEFDYDATHQGFYTPQ